MAGRQTTFRATPLLRQRRELNGWSQEQLAERAGIDESWVNQVEQGKRLLGIRAGQKWLAALGLGDLCPTCTGSGRNPNTKRSTACRTCLGEGRMPGTIFGDALEAGLLEGPLTPEEARAVRAGS